MCSTGSYSRSSRTHVLSRGHLRRQRVSPRLADVPPIQCALLGILGGRRLLHGPRNGSASALDGGSTGVRRTQRGEELGAANAGSRARWLPVGIPNARRAQYPGLHIIFPYIPRTCCKLIRRLASEMQRIPSKRIMLSYL